MRNIFKSNNLFNMMTSFQILSSLYRLYKLKQSELNNFSLHTYCYDCAAFSVTSNICSESNTNITKYALSINDDDEVTR